jgi:glycosyltransferase involved in cell wall biosynthesis
LRVGLFTNNYLPMLGGVSTAVETIRTALAHLGHEPVVVAPRMPGVPDAEPGVLRVPAIPAPTYPDFALPLPLAPAVARRLAALELDVVHAQHPFLLGVAGRRLARALGRPFVFTYHTRYDEYAHYVPLPRHLVARQAVVWSTRFASRADAVIAPSAGLAAWLRTHGVSRPIDVVPTGVDLARFEPGDQAHVRAALGLPAGPLLLYVGRLDREKNVELLLDAFQRIAAAHATVRLVLVGRGTEAGALRRRLDQRESAGRVLFVGGVPSTTVARYYQAADVFVFSSVTETQGLAVLEAMACGLPVVAVRASGVEEAVLDGVSGLLVPEEREAFAGAVLQLLGDPDLARKLAAGAREGALAFGATALGERLVRIYRRLGAERRAA